MLAPGTLIAAGRKARFSGRLSDELTEIAEALASADIVQLAAAIDAAEAGGMVVHVARMRIVLAQRTGDRAPLDLARPVLERLDDRQSLKRLEEVRHALT